MNWEDWQLMIEKNRNVLPRIPENLLFKFIIFDEIVLVVLSGGGGDFIPSPETMDCIGIDVYE